MAEVPQLRTVTRSQGNNAAFKNGEVVPEGFRPVFEEVPVLVHAFRHMVREQAYDISEMALTTYLVAKAHGVPLTAVPAFLVRDFHHGAIRVDPVSGPRHPRELEGRRVGVSRGYTVTTGVWARAVLQEEYGVDLDRVTWVLSGDEHVSAYRPPRNVEPAGPGASLAERVLSGELAAVVGGEDVPGLAPLIPDPEAAALAALEQRGWWPVNHLVVIRDELLAADPGLAARVFDAFARSKLRYVEQLRSGTLGAPGPADRRHLRVMAATGTDPLPYGIEPNREILETLLRHAVDQHLLDRAPRLADLFAPATRELTA